MRFLTAYCAQLEGQTTILDGVERMRHRPIGQLVDALREIGADIEYLGEEGFPPLRIKGCVLDKHRIVTINNPQSTQFISALLLIGANVQTNSTSPYITLTREIIDQYPIARRASNSPHGGRPIAAQAASRSKILIQDFGTCPDLYPAVALTCERLGIELHATGVESLPLKESDRLRAVAEHRTDADHRMAMALLIAGYEVDDIECISKSYPQFLEQFQRINTLKLQ
jgi:3-phosphoshikimate 1-carboxyvinyltransferase